MGLKQEKKKV